MTRQDNPVVRLRPINALKQPAETKRKAPALQQMLFFFVVDPKGIEPSTLRMRTVRSPRLSYGPK